MQDLNNNQNPSKMPKLLYLILNSNSKLRKKMLKLELKTQMSINLLLMLNGL